MLIQFTVGNFRSFKDPVLFSMIAAKLSSRDPEIDTNNIFNVNSQLTLLTSVGIYGANASGKSNLIKALRFMRSFVLNSSKESQVNEPIDIDPFLLDSETGKAPSFFEIVFLLDGIVYRYGFEVSKEKVETEWLFYTPHIKEARLFTREGDDIQPSRNFKGGQAAKPLTRPNALFLSVAAQFNNEIAKNVLNWFRSVGVISGLSDRGYSNFTTKKFINDLAFRENLVSIIRDSDVGINNIVSEKIDIDNPDALPDDMPQELKDYIKKQIKDENSLINFKTIHNFVCKDGGVSEVQFDLDDESEGTQKLFRLCGPVIDTLVSGKVLIVDEIEARMHTLLTRKLIQLFKSPETNPNHAQLIFATHDTNLLSNKLFRRDQIWFVEKDEGGASHLYSLAELKVRNDRSFEDDYLEGRYGGIPILGDMRRFVVDLDRDGENGED